jgi:Ca2+-transporting ATPase
MRRPPRPPKQPLLTRRLAFWSLFEGLVAFGVIAGIYASAINDGLGDETVRAMTFVSVVSVVFSLILVNRTYSASIVHAFLSPNIALAAVAAFVVGILSVTLAFAPIRDLFSFGALSQTQIMIAVSAGGVSLVILETLKLLFGRRTRSAFAIYRS